MKIDYQQPFELRSSIPRGILTLIACALISTWLGFAYHGDVAVMRGFDKGADSESFAGFLLLIAIPVFCYQAYKELRMNPLKPSLVLSPEGVIYRGFSSALVPWQMIAAIDVRHVEFRGNKWNVIELILADRIPDDLRVASVKSASSSFRPGVHRISIPTNSLFGHGSGEIVAIIKRYYHLYGTATQPQPDATALLPY
jgi:hypothetical protein